MSENLFAAAKKLNERIRELRAGYEEVIDLLSDYGNPLDFEDVKAHRAVLYGVISSAKEYKAYLAYQLTDGAQP